MKSSYELFNIFKIIKYLIDYSYGNKILNFCIYKDDNDVHQGRK